MRLTKLFIPYIFFSLLSLLLIGCNTSLFGPTPTTTPTNTATPVPPTPTATATFTPTFTPTITPTPTVTPFPTRDILCPAGPQSLDNISDVTIIPGIEIAPLLPFPGKFENIIMEQTEEGIKYLGVILLPGFDHTVEIVRREAMGEAVDSDILISFSEPGSGFGYYGSINGITVSFGLTNPSDILNTSFYIDYSSGLLQMVKDENRRLFLMGDIELPIYDANKKETLYWLRYDFGTDASIVWDSNEELFNWCNIEVEKFNP